MNLRQNMLESTKIIDEDDIEEEKINFNYEDKKMVMKANNQNEGEIQNEGFLKFLRDYGYEHED